MVGVVLLTAGPKLNQQEFTLLRDYIERECSIQVTEDKDYLIESRLARLVVEAGCSNYGEFYVKLTSSMDPKLRNRVVDAITTNETLWFRDGAPWIAFRDHVLPALARAAPTDRKLRIWSAACSTGQEPYTVAMLVDDFCRKNPSSGLTPDRVEIQATDISPSALFIALAGRYDRISMNRGFTDDFGHYKERYFRQRGTISEIEPTIRKRVSFKSFNLQDSFALMGPFDVILLRNVAIYFSERFKTDLFQRVRRALVPGGFFFLGATESLHGYPVELAAEKHGRAIFFRASGGEGGR